MAGVTVRKANASDKKLNLQLSQPFPFRPCIPMDETSSDARNTVKNEYFARAFRLFKRGRPFKE
jgi:hypothetical protein